MRGTSPDFPMPSQALIYRFGLYELRTRTRELYKQGIKVKLRPQPFHVLKLLVERRGDVVTREELRQLLWSAETFVDFEHGLNTSIKELRGVLSDSANNPRYIATLPRVGYRLMVPIEADQPQPVNQGIAQPQNAGAGNGVAAEISGNRALQILALWRWPVVLGISILSIAALGVYFRWSRSPSGPRPSSERAMIAVLPFENLTGDPGQDYFSDGLTEEMISQLGRFAPERLGVIARTSVMHYKQSHPPLEQIGRELTVQYVLEGSVRRDSNKVRISAQLIQMKDQTHVWARQYDRELSNLLALQAEIAQEIADEIQLTLNHEPIQRGPASPATQNYEAYDLFLKGQYFLNQRTEVSLHTAIRYFQGATAKDPTYGRGHAGLADAYALLPGYSGRPQREFIEKARAAALQALQIDERLPEAHTALALIVQNYDWDWQTSEKEFRRAIELNPSYSTAHQWYAEHLMWMGRFDQALAESEQARRLDPLSLIIAADDGAILCFSRQYDRAIEKWRSVLEMDVDFPRAHLIMLAYVEKGMFAEALAVLGERPKIITPWFLAQSAFIRGRSGQNREAQKAIDELLELSGRERVDPIIVAWAYTGLKDRPHALAWLEKAYGQHSNELTALKVNPSYDFLRGDPHFQDLLRRVGLTQ